MIIIFFLLKLFTELIPRPAKACQDPPMYLRLRMGRKLGKTSPLPNNVMSYGKNKLRPEYWFSIPKNKWVMISIKLTQKWWNWDRKQQQQQQKFDIFEKYFFRVDELYRFINAWVPQIYGDLDEEELKNRGLELIQNDTEWSTQRASSKVWLIYYWHFIKLKIFTLFSFSFFIDYYIGWHRFWWRDWWIHKRILGGKSYLFI
jgi:hypothetical protein